MKRRTSVSPEKCDEQSNKSGLTARIISGSIGSVVTSLAVTPLDVVKVRLQNSFSEAAAPARMNLPANVMACPRGCGTLVELDGVLHKNVLQQQARVPYTESHTPYSRLGTFAMVRRIFAEEGWSGIYAGIRPTLIMSVPNTVLYFSAYDEIVWRLRNRFQDPSAPWIPLVSGASARLLASSVTAPFEFLRTREASMVGGQGQQQSSISHVRDIIRVEGASSLFRGLRPTLWRDVPFSAVYWLCLERFREMWRTDDVIPSPLEQAGQAFVNGAVAGMIAAALTTPFDVIKTRQQSALQANIASSSRFDCHHDGAVAYEGGATPKVSEGTFASLRHIAETEGVAGLWRGNQARMLKVAPACAIMISCYEFGKRILE